MPEVLGLPALLCDCTDEIVQFTSIYSYEQIRVRGRHVPVICLRFFEAATAAPWGISLIIFLCRPIKPRKEDQDVALILQGPLLPGYMIVSEVFAELFEFCLQFIVIMHGYKKNITNCWQGTKSYDIIIRHIFSNIICSS